MALTPSLLWGLGLGVTDGAMFSLIRDSYADWSAGQKANGPADYLTRVWQNLILAGIIGGVVVPYFYFWSAFSVGTLVEIHIYRCLLSLLISLCIAYSYKDTINGFMGLGLTFTAIGLCLILMSTAY